jgi:hypothetical protein
MRTIAALLPWYTRPLTNFGHYAISTAEIASRVIEEIVRRQDSLAAEIEELKNSRD